MDDDSRTRGKDWGETAKLMAERKLRMLVESSQLLGREKDPSVLQKHILFGAREIANCALATLFLRTRNNTLRFAMRTSSDELPALEIPLFNTDGSSNERFVVVHAALKNETVIIDDVYSETRFDLSGTKEFSKNSGFLTVSMLTVPLSLYSGEVVGVLQLVNALDEDSGVAIPFPRELVSYIEALAAQSAAAIENQRLIESQKRLTDSLFNLIAVAIDAKSPYTGGHCERVPELALMLAEEASKAKDGPLEAFSFRTEDEWYEFRVGALLHDCGKVTTPEYVADKATKLETLYNRIHEVRTRFEVLLRDARIERLEAILAGQDVKEADAALARREKQLSDDFAFVAECNIGSEFMGQEHVERLGRIGAQTWMRHFDDRLGLSHEELKRYKGTPAAQLPVKERLIADKPSHIVPHHEKTIFDPKYEFKVRIPENFNNLGELYNLSIARGTLNEEERFKINEHVLQTIVMLDALALPKHLERIPEYASSHHETLAGNGYPRKLTADKLSIPARIMTIADIFEALTASDRPYKKAKTLSESVQILSYFKRDGLIDPDLFDLFLKSGVYKRYGERFLAPEQMDEVDIGRYVGQGV